MGLLSLIRKLQRQEKNIRLLVLGLDNAGKTTVMRRVSGEDILQVQPTKGFNIDSFEKNDGVIWVVDAADDCRLQQTETELLSLLITEKLAGASLLVFINKIDLLPADQQNQCPALRHMQEVVARASADGTRHCRIQLCSAVTGSGLLDGLDWLVSDIASRIFLDL
ncbi:ARF/SAR superfamily [Pelomyxa schiedti]|nr:ARF/SAR superfamily [Pelomyxa schiedti]